MVLPCGDREQPSGCGLSSGLLVLSLLGRAEVHTKWGPTCPSGERFLSLQCSLGGRGRQGRAEACQELEHPVPVLNISEMSEELFNSYRNWQSKRHLQSCSRGQKSLFSGHMCCVASLPSLPLGIGYKCVDTQVP